MLARNSVLDGTTQPLFPRDFAAFHDPLGVAGTVTVDGLPRNPAKLYPWDRGPL